MWVFISPMVSSWLSGLQLELYHRNQNTCEAPGDYGFGVGFQWLGLTFFDH